MGRTEINTEIGRYWRVEIHVSWGTVANASRIVVRGGGRTLADSTGAGSTTVFFVRGVSDPAHLLEITAVAYPNSYSSYRQSDASRVTVSY